MTIRIDRSLGIALVALWVFCGAPLADANPHDWPMYQHDIRRTGFNPNETKIHRTSVGLLRLKWAFHAGDSITSSPVVVHFEDFAGQGPRKVVYVGSADENFYAIDAANGSVIWQQTADPAPGIAYNMFVSSPFVDKARNQVYVAGGFTMYAFDLFTGAVRWKWSTGPNPQRSDPTTHGGGEIESSPLLLEDGNGNGTVYFGSDMDGRISSVVQQFPALFALDAATGDLRWYWRPNRRPEPLLNRCGSVWCSVSADPELGLLYFDTADCTRSFQGLYNESVISLSIVPPPGSVDPTSKQRNDDPSWYYQPWANDPYDNDFGSTPLLFDRDGKQYLGVGGKDGHYYVMERAPGAVSGELRGLKWKTRVVRGGYAGGFIGGSATDGNTIWGATALFDTPPSPNPLVQPPFLHAFDALTGEILWQQIVTGPTFAATTAVPGVVFIGSTDGTFIAVDAETGQALWGYPAIGAVSSGAAISDGEVFVGAGTKAESYNLGQGPINALYAFHLPPGAPAEPDPNVPPKLPPASWPLGVVQFPLPPDGAVPNPTPTPGS